MAAPLSSQGLLSVKKLQPYEILKPLFIEAMLEKEYSFE